MDPFSNADPDSLAVLRLVVRPSGFALKADGFWERHRFSDKVRRDDIFDNKRVVFQKECTVFQRKLCVQLSKICYSLGTKAEVVRPAVKTFASGNSTRALPVRPIRFKRRDP